MKNILFCTENIRFTSAFIGSSSGSVASSASSKRDPIQNTINGKTYWSPDMDKKPYKGQTFTTFEDGLDFYKNMYEKVVLKQQLDLQRH